MELLLAKIIAITFIILDMYKDGKWKDTGKLSYWCKDLMYMLVIAFGWLTFYFPDILLSWELYAGILLLKKPVSDIAYSVGNNQRGIYIGTENWSDKLMRKLGLVELERTKFPAITFLYIAMIIAGLFLGF